MRPWASCWPAEPAQVPAAARVALGPVAGPDAGGVDPGVRLEGAAGPEPPGPGDVAGHLAQRDRRRLDAGPGGRRLGVLGHGHRSLGQVGEDATVGRRAGAPPPTSTAGPRPGPPGRRASPPRRAGRTRRPPPPPGPPGRRPRRSGSRSATPWPWAGAGSARRRGRGSEHQATRPGGSPERASSSNRAASTPSRRANESVTLAAFSVHTRGRDWPSASANPATAPDGSGGRARWPPRTVPDVPIDTAEVARLEPETERRRHVVAGPGPEHHLADLATRRPGRSRGHAAAPTRRGPAGPSTSGQPAPGGHREVARPPRRRPGR